MGYRMGMEIPCEWDKNEVNRGKREGMGMIARERGMRLSKIIPSQSVICNIQAYHIFFTDIRQVAPVHCISSIWALRRYAVY